MTTRDIYLNHAGTSWPKPQVVLDAVQEAMSAPTTSWSQRFEAAHQAIADFFNVQRPEQILITPGCTSAISIGVSDALIPSGKRILTSRWEHHALHRPLLKLASTGVRVDYIPTKPTEGGQGSIHSSSIDLSWLEDELSKKDVGLVAVTAACNVTGEVLPFEDVIRLAQKYDSLVMLDAAQVVGWVKLDLPELGADFVAFGGHKGLQAPWGIGGLFVSERAQMRCVSATCELPTESSDKTSSNIRPSYCDVGSVDQIALAGLHAAVHFLSQQDMNSNLANARKQIQRTRDALNQIEPIQTIGFGEKGMPTTAFSIPGLSSKQMANHLAHHQLTVGSGIHCAPLAHETLGTQESGLVRLSVGVGQQDDDIDEAIDRLDQAFNDESLHKLRSTQGIKELKGN